MDRAAIIAELDAIIDHNAPLTRSFRYVEVTPEPEAPAREPIIRYHTGGSQSTYVKAPEPDASSVRQLDDESTKKKKIVIERYTPFLERLLDLFPLPEPTLTAQKAIWEYNSCIAKLKNDNRESIRDEQRKVLLTAEDRFIVFVAISYLIHNRGAVAFFPQRVVDFWKSVTSMAR